MQISNSKEYKINWNVRLDQKRGDFGGQKLLRSIGNMVFMRGDGVY